ncbi:hypothetical protein FRAHR75_310045 [Frankia sp. Hr75.2]|nr:hypothetical protein FRAHR75_310045 [Frankia sp. Hr75.2]
MLVTGARAQRRGPCSTYRSRRRSGSCVPPVLAPPGAFRCPLPASRVPGRFLRGRTSRFRRDVPARSGGDVLARAGRVPRRVDGTGDLPGHRARAAAQAAAALSRHGAAGRAEAR